VLLMWFSETQTSAMSNVKNNNGIPFNGEEHRSKRTALRHLGER
jgi:hypothetical protein